MPEFRVQAEPEYDVIPKVGSIQFEYGVRGTELEQKLRKAQEQFVRAMEIQGLTLMSLGNEANPKWTTNEDGSMAAWYAIDWLSERPAPMGPDGEPLPRTRETSLEETGGMVEYRIVGIFWGPKTSMEILRSKAEIRDEEHAALNPTQFGYGSAGGGDTLYTPEKEFTRNVEREEDQNP